MTKQYLDSAGLARLWGKVKEYSDANALSPLYVVEESVLETTAALPTYRESVWMSDATINYNTGELYTSSNSDAKIGRIDLLGLKAGDRLLIRAHHTHNTTQYGFRVAFFNKAVTDPETGETTIGDVELGDIAMQYVSFAHQGELKDVGEVTVPEGATHMVLAHYRPNIKLWMEAHLIVRAEEVIDHATITDYLEDWRTRYSVSSRKPIRGGNGNVYGSNYGAAGVYYGISTYIDIRYVERLCFRLESANAGPSGVGGMALLAAYDADKTYMPDHSIIATAACTRQGEWIRPEGCCYIRLTICTTRNPLYLFDPDRIGTLERMATAAAGGGSTSDEPSMWSGRLEQGDTLTFPADCYGALRLVNSDDGEGGGAVIRDFLVDVPQTVLEVASCYPSMASNYSIDIDVNAHTIEINEGTAVWQFTGNMKPLSSTAGVSLMSTADLQSVSGLETMDNDIEPIGGEDL